MRDMRPGEHTEAAEATEATTEPRRDGDRRSSEKIGLAALIHPRAVAELAAHLARDEAFVVPRTAVPELAAIPMLASVDALLGAWPDSVHVHLPDVADEASSITASPHDARKLYANRMGLLFDEAQRFVPELAAWLATIRVELGLSALTQARCLVYATPAGTGTAAHFDHNVNFVLQLRGQKTWWLAPNAHVERPLSRHTMGLPADPELAAYARHPLPEDMPADRREVALAPGALMCVPRGMWHATRADEDSLQLNFTFTPPSWIDLLSAALRSRLAQSPAWRAIATPHEPAAFAALLRELADDAREWSADDILAATEASG